MASTAAAGREGAIEGRAVRLLQKHVSRAAAADVSPRLCPLPAGWTDHRLVLALPA